MTLSSIRTGKTALLGAALIGSMGFARQGQVPYRSPDGQLTILFGSFLLLTQPDGSHRMVIKGGLDATSRSQGLRVKARSGNAVLTTAGKITAFRTVHLDQAVELVKTAAGTKGSRSVDLTCSQADYLAGTTQSTVKARGNVRIVDRDTGRNETMSATGSSCVATVIAGRSAETSPLKTANLSGPVTVHLEQAPEGPGKPPGTVVATSNTLTYQAGTSPRITLSGNVVLQGTGSSLGKLGPVRVMVLELDAALRIKTVSGGPQ